MVFYFFIRKSLPKIIFSVSFYLLSPSSSLGTVAGDHLSSSSAARAGPGAAWSLGAVPAEMCCGCAVVWGPGTFGAAQGSQGRWSLVWPGWLAVCLTTPTVCLQCSPASRLLAVITGSAGGWHPPTAFCLVPVLL